MTGLCPRVAGRVVEGSLPVEGEDREGSGAAGAAGARPVDLSRMGLAGGGWGGCWGVRERMRCRGEGREGRGSVGDGRRAGGTAAGEALREEAGGAGLGAVGEAAGGAAAGSAGRAAFGFGDSFEVEFRLGARVFFSCAALVAGEHLIRSAAPAFSVFVGVGFGFEAGVGEVVGRVAGDGLRNSGYGLRVTGDGLQVTGDGLRVTGVGLRNSGVGFRVTGCGLRPFFVWLGRGPEGPLFLRGAALQRCWLRFVRRSWRGGRG